MKTFIRNLNAIPEIADAKKFAVSSLAKAVEKLEYNADNVEVVVIKYVDGEVRSEYVTDEEVNALCEEVKGEDEDAFAEH